jgi:glycosyltransferase involved in cell wall biosynthesis
MHLIAMGLAKQTQIPWIADFRDPWTEIDYYRDLMLSGRADRKHRKLEREVLRNASALTVVSQDMKQQFGNKETGRIEVIPNGFDRDDYNDATSMREEKVFSLTHIGTIVPSRNPVVLWNAISELVKENEEFAKELKIRLVGFVDYSVLRSIEEAGLEKWIEKIDYLEHKKAIERMEISKVLLLLINKTPNAKGILTGKFFEYLGSGRPILAIGPTDGEAGRILNETGSGRIVGFSNHEVLKKTILEFYDMYRKGELENRSAEVDAYSRKQLTSDMTALFNHFLGAPE